VTVLDEEAEAYARIWCLFELAETLRISTKLHDIVTYFTYEDPLEDVIHKAAAIIQGNSRGYHSSIGINLQVEHEANFPLDLVERALSVRVQDGQASLEKDRRHILNTIAGVSDLDSEPLREHPGYEAINSLLRGCFANAALRNAAEQGRLANFTFAMRESRRTHVNWDFSGCDRLSDEILEEIACCLPLELETLELHLVCCGDVTDSGFGSLVKAISKLPRLHKLMLDLNGTSAGDKTFECLTHSSLPSSLAHVDLRVTGCDNLTDMGFQSIAAALSQQNQLKSVVLRLGETEVGKEAADSLSLVMQNLGVDCSIMVACRIVQKPEEFNDKCAKVR